MSDEELNKQSLGYRPEIKYEDEYYSEQSKDYDIPDSSVDIDNSIKDNINNNINKDDLLLELIPEDISDVIKETYDIAKDIWINELSKEDYRPIQYDNTQITEKDNGPDADPDSITEDSFWDDDSEYDDEYYIYDEEIIIRQEYNKNMMDLLDYYFEALGDALSNYSLGYIMVFNKKSKTDSANIRNSILHADHKIKVTKGNEHLLDVGFRTELMSDLKLRFMRRMCPVDQSMMMFANFKVVTELRKKYARMTYLDTDKREDNMSDALLSASKELYSDKYDKSFTELYRYLKGSVELSKDVLQEALGSYKAKQTIAEKGGFEKDNVTDNSSTR